MPCNAMTEKYKKTKQEKRRADILKTSLKIGSQKSIYDLSY